MGIWNPSGGGGGALVSVLDAQFSTASAVAVDTGISLPVEANKVYLFILQIDATNDNVAGGIISISVPAGATIKAFGVSSSADVPASFGQLDQTTTLTPASSVLKGKFHIGKLTTVGAAGVVKIQALATAGTTVVSADSGIELVKV